MAERRGRRARDERASPSATSRAEPEGPDPVAAVLATERADLESELDRLTASRGEAGGISFGKRVGEGTSIAVDRLSSVAAHERLSHKLVSVRRAQDKLDEGTYGRCDVCGEPIPAERLEALPYAVVCVQHASPKR